MTVLDLLASYLTLEVSIRVRVWVFILWAVVLAVFLGYSLGRNRSCRGRRQPLQGST